MTACSPLISFAVSPGSAGHHAPLAERPETCACDFTDVFAVRQPTISQHLKVLREAGLVHTRRCGTQICYSIDPGHLDDLRGSWQTCDPRSPPPPLGAASQFRPVKAVAS